MQIGQIYAAHQPNFFPWLGFFHKVLHCDKFVFLDDVQFPKSGGGTYINRVRLRIGGKAQWSTAPVDRKFNGVKTIAEMNFADERWNRKFVKTYKHAYAKAPYVDQALNILESLGSAGERGVAMFNFRAVSLICEVLGIDISKFVFSSSLSINSAGGQRLIDIGHSLGCGRYLCGGGASGYQDDVLMAEQGITVVYQNFVHPTYTQVGGVDFLPGLSVLDALANCGAKSVREMLNKA